MPIEPASPLPVPPSQPTPPGTPTVAPSEAAARVAGAVALAAATPPLGRRGSDRSNREPAPASGPSPGPGAPAPGLPVAGVLAGLALGSVLVAGALAWALQAAAGLAAPWAAAAGAALALLAVAGPALVLVLNGLHRLRKETTPAAPAKLQPVHDSATGAFRRDLFMELAEREWARARRYGSGAGLLIVDLDHAARLLATHGPQAADLFLTALMRETSPTLRGPDLITRLGPAQIGVFLAHADPTGALDVAERIRERAEALQAAGPGAATEASAASAAMPTLRCTVSVGVAQLRPAHLNLQSLLHEAEEAVIAARQAGGNCVRAAPVDVGLPPAADGWRNDHDTR